jgi:hypothetical protein
MKSVIPKSSYSPTRRDIVKQDLKSQRLDLAFWKLYSGNCLLEVSTEDTEFRPFESPELHKLLLPTGKRTSGQSL